MHHLTLTIPLSNRLNKIRRKAGTRKSPEHWSFNLCSGLFSVRQLPIFAFTLSSAFNGLTSVFEMGTGVSHWLSPPYLSMDLSKTNISSKVTTTVLTFLSNLRLSFRPISTGQLHPSRNFHLQPISLSSLRAYIPQILSWARLRA